MVGWSDELRSNEEFVETTKSSCPDDGSSLILSKVPNVNIST